VKRGRVVREAIRQRCDLVVTERTERFVGALVCVFADDVQLRAVARREANALAVITG